MKWATIVPKIAPAQQIEVKNVAPTLGEGAVTDKVFLYTESQKPDEQMTAFEDEHGTYFMNSKICVQYNTWKN